MAFDNEGHPVPHLDEAMDVDEPNIEDINAEANHAPDQYEYITDMRSVIENETRSLEYSYKSIPDNSLYNRMWAGPEHWKLKHINHFTTSTPKPKKTRSKHSIFEPINFENINAESVRHLIKFNDKAITRQSVMADDRMLPENLNLKDDDIMHKLFHCEAFSRFGKSGEDTLISAQRCEVLGNENFGESLRNEDLNMHLNNSVGDNSTNSKNSQLNFDEIEEDNLIAGNIFILY